MTLPVLPVVRLSGKEFVTPDGKVVAIPSPSEGSPSWREENLVRQQTAPAGQLPTESPLWEENGSDGNVYEADAGQENQDEAGSPGASGSDNSQPSRSPGPPRFSRALSLPLPSQLGYLKHPYRSDVTSPMQEESATPDSIRLHELSRELADSVHMAVQTMVHISPPHILDPAKEQFSACALSIPMASMSAMLTTMKNLNYISAHMSGLCSPSRSGNASPATPSVEQLAFTEFDIGEMLQSVGDALSGEAALAGVDLVLYHGDDIGLRHVIVQGDENGMSYILVHMVRRILDTTKPGDSIELGLLIGPADTKLPEDVMEPSVQEPDRSLSCVIRISHKFNGETPGGGRPLPSRPQPNLVSLTLRRLLDGLGASIATDLPPPSSITYGRSCELSLNLDAGVSLAETPTASLLNEDDPISGEPTVEQLISFAESLRGRRVTLYADEKGSFAQHLTSYLTAWGMDVTHVSPSGEVDGLADPVFGQLVAAMPLAPVTAAAAAAASAAQASMSREKTAAVAAAPSFVFIDDDIDVLRERMRLLRAEKTLGGQLRQRPSLAAHHRPKSSPQITRAMGANLTIGTQTTPAAPSVIVHFTSLSNYKLVKDVVQSVIAFHLNSNLPIPEIMIIPKPAGPRRFLTALHTAITKPMVDPIFTPIATTPSSPNVPSGGYFFQNHHANMESSSGSPRANGKNGRPHSSRTNSDRSAKSTTTSEMYHHHPPSPSPLALSDNAEYFSEAATKLGASPSSGLVIQSPDGQPAGIFFNPKRGGSSKTPSTHNMERDKGHLQVSTDPATRRRSSSRLSITDTSSSPFSPFSLLHAVTSSPTATSPVNAASPSGRVIVGSPSSIRKSPRMSSIDENSSAGPSREGSGGTVMPRRSGPSTPEAEKRPTPPASPRSGALASGGGTPSWKRGRRGPLDGSGGGSPGSSGGLVGKKKARPAETTIVPPIKVLIVDDNPINQTILSTFMRKKQIRYDVANNGQEAVEKWKTGEFHLILMDIQMPVMDGIQATKEIRRTEAQNAASGYPPSDHILSRTPSETSSTTSTSSRPASTPHRSSVIIVALTASSLESDRVAALTAGCNDFLTKPVSLRWLNSKIVEWGSIKALQRWADPNLDGPRGVGVEQARSVAERLHVPARGRRTPSPNRNSSASTVTPATVGGGRSDVEASSSPHRRKSLEDSAQDLAQDGRPGSTKSQINEEATRTDEDSA